MSIGLSKIENPSVILQERVITVFLMTIFLEILTFFANAVGRLAFGSSSLDTMIVYGIYLYNIVRILPIIPRKFNIKLVIFLMCFAAFFCVSLYINPDFEKESDAHNNIIMSVVSGLFFGAAITDWDMCLEKLVAFARPLAMMMLASFFIYDTVFNTFWGEGAMGLSYKMLIPAILILYKLLTKVNLMDLVLLVAILFIMLLQGSRGPFLSVGVYFVLYMIANYKKYTTKVLMYMSLALIAIVILFLNIDYFLYYLEQVAINNEFEAKIITWALEGKLADLNGRDVLYDQSMEMIKEHTIVGVGIFGERELLGSYCHNIILEFLLDFGAVPGTLLIATLLLGLINRIVTCSTSQKNVIMMLLGMFIVKLFMSGSFWLESVFFMLVSIVMNKPNDTERL